MRVLVVEGWYRGSHRAWLDGWVGHSRHRIDLVAVGDLRWRRTWRRGALEAAPAVTGEHDAVVVSGPVDLARLRGLAPRGSGPWIRMQHETEACYPQRSGGAPPDEVVAADLSGLEAADRVWFASDWHRRSARSALDRWAAPIPTTWDVRAEVLPLGLDLEQFGDPADESGGDPADGEADRWPTDDPRPVVLWPHRWDHDKDPEAFARAVAPLRGRIRLVLAGDEPTGGPSGVRRALAEDWGRDAVVGPFDRAAYRSWCRRADLVVSCARHEFFGLGVAEAVAAGAVPVVPGALSYPEVLGAGVGYEPGRFGSALRAAVEAWPERPPGVDAVRARLRTRDWSTVARLWDDAVERAVAGVPEEER